MPAFTCKTLSASFFSPYPKHSRTRGVSNGTCMAVHEGTAQADADMLCSWLRKQRRVLTLWVATGVALGIDGSYRTGEMPLHTPCTVLLLHTWLLYMLVSNVNGSNVQSTTCVDRFQFESTTCMACSGMHASCMSGTVRPRSIPVYLPVLKQEPHVCPMLCSSHISAASSFRLHVFIFFGRIDSRCSCFMTELYGNSHDIHSHLLPCTTTCIAFELHDAHQT